MKKNIAFWLSLVLLLAFLFLPVSARGSEVIPTTVNFQLNNIVESEKPDSDSDFQFTLISLAGSPMPDGSQNGTKEIVRRGEGAASFGTITFSSVGDYRYEIRQTTADAGGYTYDRTVYVVTVQVTWKSESSNELLSAVVIEKKNEHRKANHIYYTNKFSSISITDVPGDGSEEPGTLTPGGGDEFTDHPQTGDDYNLSLWLLLCVLSAVGIVLLGVSSARDKSRGRNEG